MTSGTAPEGASQIPFHPVTPDAIAKLEPAEHIAFTVAASQVARDENPGINTTAALLLTIQRLIAEPAVPSPSVVAALDRETLGRIVHEVRCAENAKLDRPFRLEPWDRRSPSQQALDMRIAEAVAAAVQERSEGERAKLAAVEALCREVPARADLAHVTAKRILAIIGGEKGSDRG